MKPKRNDEERRSVESAHRTHVGCVLCSPRLCFSLSALRLRPSVLIGAPYGGIAIAHLPVDCTGHALTTKASHHQLTTHPLSPKLLRTRFGVWGPPWPSPCPPGTSQGLSGDLYTMIPSLHACSTALHLFFRHLKAVGWRRVFQCWN
jgi:hypothetical protein